MKEKWAILGSFWMYIHKTCLGNYLVLKFFWCVMYIQKSAHKCKLDVISQTEFVVQLLSCVQLLQPHGMQHVRLPCPSPSPGACSSSGPWSWWYHPAISSSVVPSPPAFSLSQYQVFFLRSQFFASDGQSIGVSALASVLPMNIQDWFPLGLTGLILQSKGLQLANRYVTAC